MTKIAVSISEAVAITGIGRTSLYALIKDERLAPRKLGRRTLILVQDLEAFMASLPSQMEK